MEELREKMEEAKKLGLVNVMSNIQDEMSFREMIPDKKDRDAIRKIKIEKNLESLRHAIEIHKENEE